MAQYHVPNSTGLTFVHWLSSKFQVYTIQGPSWSLVFFLNIHRDMRLQLIDTTFKITPGSFPQSEYLTVCTIRTTSGRQGVLLLKDVLRSLTPGLNVSIHAQSSELVLCAPEFWGLDGLGINGWKLAPIPNSTWHNGCAPLCTSEPSRYTVAWNRALPHSLHPQPEKKK